ncbi:cupredoxin domain-containing protein [Mycolicibacterium sp. XJ870]
MKRMTMFCGAFGAAVCLFAAACGQSDTEVSDPGAATQTASPTEASPTEASPTEASPTEASPTAEPAPGGPTITIEGMGFSGGLTVAPGAQITIVNNDEVEHSVTSRTADLFDVHVDGKQRATLTAPSEPGEYAFYCIYHPAMVGTLTVR